MNAPSLSGDVNFSDNQILALAALFDHPFSIDWIIELSSSKASIVLKLFEKARREEILTSPELGTFSFTDLDKKEELKSFLSGKQQDALHKKIAAFIINEGEDSGQAVLKAAHQLLCVTNDAAGCSILLEAGDRHRKKGASEKAMQCYNKAIQDLSLSKGREADTLFVKTVISYSKDRLSLIDPDLTLSLLKKALKKTETLNDKMTQSITLLHLASLQYQLLQHTSAQKNFNKGKKLARDIKDPQLEQTMNACSLVHYCYTGRFKDAVEKYESLGGIFSKNASGYRLSLKIGIIIGLSYANIGQIPQALGMLNQLRDDALASGDPDAASRASIHIAVVLILKNDLEKAALILTKTFKSSQKMDWTIKSLTNLLQAHIYFEKKKYKTSHRFLKEALEKRNHTSLALKGVLLQFCLAMKKGLYPAVPGLSLEKEIETAINMGNTYNRGIAYRYKAWWLKEKNAPHQEIKKYLLKSLEQLKISGALMEMALTQEVLGRFYKEQGETEKAKLYVESAAKILQKHGGRTVSGDLAHLLKNFLIKESLVEEILSFGPEVVEIKNIKKVAQRILTTAIKITGAERGAIFLSAKDKKGAPIELLAAKNLDRSDMKKKEFELSEKLILESAGTGREQFDDSSMEDTASDAIKSRICIPLLRRGKPMGVLYHDNRLLKSPFKKQDIKILSYFASLATIALDNASAYEEIQSLNQRLYEEKQYLEEQQLEQLYFDDFVAASSEIKNVLTLVERVADTEATVLILGDTGVGKEMVARAIHQQSARRDKPFIRVNCSAFPESLIASELFGHEKGSFTGAGKQRIGRFELADTGTLFLDEIGDISMDIQVRLLRVLQTKKFERVGSSDSIQSDFRLLTATNRNLEKAVAEGRFRQDLYYRLNVFPIYVPPLRKRADDIAPLALHFLKKHSDKMKKAFKGIPKPEMNKLLQYHWPGNVRELENVIERGVILNTEELFTVPELSIEASDRHVAGKITLKEMEKNFIFDTLQEVNWKIYGPGGAAEVLGLNHSTLYSKMKKLGIKNLKKTRRHT